MSAGPSPVTSYTTVISVPFPGTPGRSEGRAGISGTSVGKAGSDGSVIGSSASLALCVALRTTRTPAVTAPPHTSTATATMTATSGTLLRRGGGNGAGWYPGGG